MTNHKCIGINEILCDNSIKFLRFLRLLRILKLYDSRIEFTNEMTEQVQQI